MGSPPPHVIPRTEVYRVRAATIDQEYRISVAPPRGYADGGGPYPVLYVLDADIGFGTVVEGYRMLSLDRQLHEILIVGIGYPVEDLTETLVARTRDLTPTIAAGKLRELSEQGLGNNAASFIGGAGAFLDFIRGELMPFITDRYRSDPSDVGIAGASFGGLFATWCLFSQPAVFGRLIAVSPSLGWDDGVIFRLEQERARRSRELPAKLFLSVGRDESPEMLRNARRLAARLRRRRYEGLELTVLTMAGEIHRSVWAPAMLRGLRVLYGTT